MREIRSRPGKGSESEYLLVCRGGAQGGTEREFVSGPLSFDPGQPVIGKEVMVYADPDNPERYYVHVDPLFKRN